MQTSYLQIILETKRNSIFVLFIRKNDVANCFSQQSTHPCRNIPEKKAVVNIAKIKSIQFLRLAQSLLRVVFQCRDRTYNIFWKQKETPFFVFIYLKK